MIQTAVHHLIRRACTQEARRFEAALSDPEAAQRACLTRVLRLCADTPAGASAGLSGIHDYETFSHALPVTEYADWRDRIERQKSGQMSLARRVDRFEPTSGSTGERKWIPYTSEFLTEMNHAARAWLSDVYDSCPAVSRGSHFWSLSWIPRDLRGTLEADDIQLFPWDQRILLKSVIATHPGIPRAPSSDAAWWTTLLLVASRADLTFVSVWSPTYALALFREIFSNREMIGRALREGEWIQFSKVLRGFRAPMRTNFPVDAKDFTEFIRRAWPGLALISAWDQAESQPYAQQLSHLLPGIKVQGKGLCATEGIISIPWRGSWPLAVRSHFLEFRSLSSGVVLPSWELEPGDEVQPILTTSSGLLRYALADRMQVTGYQGRTPTVKFLGRLGGVDLVGEKLGYAKAAEILRQAEARFTGLEAFCLGAFRKGAAAQYSLLGVGSPSRTAEVAAFIEAELSQIHHYRVARELHQILSAGAQIFRTCEELDSLLGRSDVPGRSKPASIRILPSDVLKS